MNSQVEPEPQKHTLIPPSVFLYKYQGFWYGQNFLPGVQKVQELGLTTSSTDIILCSCIKTGTTWLKALAFSIATRACVRPESEQNPLLKSVSHDLIPHIETDIALRHTSRDPELPLLSTHMPFTSLPKSLLSSGCKIVYICRNPKDVFVSYWKFLQKIYKENLIPVEGIFEDFCNGISVCGPYWDHVLGYWNASMEDSDRVLFLKYEDMMEDTHLPVRRLAEFMGYPFSSEEDRDGVSERIVKMCSFENLSKVEVNKTGKYNTTEEPGSAYSNSIFFRKAKVEDWRNYLTPAMASKIDQISLEKFGNSGLTLIDQLVKIDQVRLFF